MIISKLNRWNTCSSLLALHWDKLQGKVNKFEMTDSQLLSTKHVKIAASLKSMTQQHAEGRNMAVTVRNF